MKFLFKYTNLWPLVFLIIPGVAIAFYGARELQFPYWDYALYHQWAKLMMAHWAKDFTYALALLQKSMAEDYNYLFTLPHLLSFTFFGDTRPVFILTNYIAFGAPLLLIFAAIAKFYRATGSSLLPMVLFFLVPITWIPLLDGYPDLGALAFLAAAFWLWLKTYPETCQRKMSYFVGIGLLLAFCILFRRHFAYAALAFLATIFLIDAVKAIIKCRQEKTGRLFLRVILHYVVLTIVILATIGLLAPDYVTRVLRTDFQTMYLSYAKEPLQLFNILIGGGGWILWSLANIGYGLAYQQRRDILALMLPLWLCLWFGLWILGPAQGGHHYFLHIAPLYLGLGLICLWESITHYSYQKIAKITLLGFLIFNAGQALWFADRYQIRNFADDVFPTYLLAKPHPPVFRQDADALRALTNHLMQSTTAGDGIMVVASSHHVNTDLLMGVARSLQPETNLQERFVETPEVDRRERLPLNGFAKASVFVVATPTQYHLRAEGQKVVGAIAALFPPTGNLASFLKRDEAIYQLENNVRVEIWRRPKAWPTALLSEQLQKIRAFTANSGSLPQDWVTTSSLQPLFTYTDPGLRTNIDTLIGHRSLRGEARLLFDMPLTPGQHEISGRLHEATTCEKTDMVWRFISQDDVVISERKNLLSPPDKTSFRLLLNKEMAKKPFYITLELSSAVAGRRLCRLVLQDLQIVRVGER
jgi:hypothetical protein